MKNRTPLTYKDGINIDSNANIKRLTLHFFAQLPLYRGEMGYLILYGMLYKVSEKFTRRRGRQLVKYVCVSLLLFVRNIKGHTQLQPIT